MEPEGSFPHSQLDPVHALTSYFLNIHLNIILRSTPWSPKWFFPSGFSAKTLYTSLFSPVRATCPAHLILDFYYPNNIGWAVKIIKLLIM